MECLAFSQDDQTVMEDCPLMRADSVMWTDNPETGEQERGKEGEGSVIKGDGTVSMIWGDGLAMSEREMGNATINDGDYTIKDGAESTTKTTGLGTERRTMYVMCVRCLDE